MTIKKNPTTRKKKAAVPAEGPEAVGLQPESADPALSAAPRQAPPPPVRPSRISLSDFWQMRAAAAEVKQRAAEAEAARMKKLYILALIDPKNRVSDQEKAIDTATKAGEAAENTRISIVRSLERQLGCALSSVGIDPFSGEVQYK